MKHIASIAGAALAFSLVAAPAIAAPHGNHGAPQQNNQGGWNNHNNGGNQGGNARTRRDNGQHQSNNNNNGGNWQNKGPQNNQAHNAGPRNNGGQKNHNNWQQNRNTNAHADYNRFRRNFRSAQRFRVARYRAPASYNYRRWSYGQYLPFEYRANNFWLANALVYGLFQAPPGLVWVRYGDDALLIDRYTGEIVQVRYDIFYW